LVSSTMNLDLDIRTQRMPADNPSPGHKPPPASSTESSTETTESHSRHHRNATV
jgi:hypothetical protein